jgi:hypothetical protein
MNSDGTENHPFIIKWKNETNPKGRTNENVKHTPNLFRGASSKRGIKDLYSYHMYI